MSAMREVPGGLDELGAARLVEGRAILADLDSEHDGLRAAADAEAFADAVADGGQGVEGPAMRALQAWDVADRLAGLPAEQVRCLLFALAERLAVGRAEYAERADWLAEIAEMPLGLVAGDVRVLAAVAEPVAGSGGYQPYRPFDVVLRMVEALLAEAALGAEALADAVADQVLSWNAMVYHWYGADAILRADEQYLREWFAGLRTVAFDGLNSVKVPDTSRNRAWLGKIRHRLGLPGRLPRPTPDGPGRDGTRGLLGATVGSVSDRD